MNIIVTGASSGIGHELVKIFALNYDAKVIAIARDKSKLEELQEECNVAGSTSEVRVQAFDLSKDNYNDLTELIIQDYQKIDILVNNAGQLVNKKFIQTSVDDLSELFEINFFAPYKLIQALHPFMQKSGGHNFSHIVNIGSMGGYQGASKFVGLSAYSASKAALANLTECLAEEFKNDGIRVNCLALGSVQTAMLEKAFPGYAASSGANQMAKYIADFSLNGSSLFNGKIIPVSISTP